ncbi:MAG: flagellar motor switch phosphatase FliY [Oscillospiraceae bacterium]|nr:flagellar motor switch phosphatase FliY [Oscillospiraceae bacterium]
MSMKSITDTQKDAIGEIMNIAMGSAATAASELLNAKVWITTPEVSVLQASTMKREELEPAICVKIVYTKGITGSNLMLLKQNDVQMILNQLMGQPLEISPDFEFDELNISAVSEVMNQMMGSASTSLSKFLEMNIDISTPVPHIMDQINLSELQDFGPDDMVVAVNFNLTIEDVINSEFVSVLSIDLARELSDRLIELNTPQEEPEPEPESAPAPIAQQPELSAAQPGTTPAQGYPPQGVMPQPPQSPQGYPPPGMGYPPEMAYGYPQPYGGYPMQMPINIQTAQLHQFESFGSSLSGEQKDNLQLLLGVPLQISVEIGTARRRVKDILEFTQGTIIELERQAGAPVDVMVNGNLIARGDVVVIDDNFAVRITEIIKSKFMDSLGKE